MPPEAIQTLFENIREFLDPRHIAAGGYAVIALVVFTETGIAMGVIMPGESLVLVAGMLAAAGHLKLSILMPSLFVASVVGDAVGFAVGAHLGPRIFSRRKSIFFRPEYLERASLFYEKYGGRAIVLARFVPVVRTFAPIVAGAARMQYRQFVVYNIIGAALWVVSILHIGYYLGRAIPDLESKLGWVIVLVVLISFVVPVFDFFRQRARSWSVRRAEPQGGAERGK
jgi:membrane-associated protein